MVTVPHIDLELLTHCLTEREELRCLWIDTDNAKRATFRYRLHCPDDDLGGCVPLMPIVALRLVLGCHLFHLFLKLCFMLIRFLRGWTGVRTIGIHTDCIASTVSTHAMCGLQTDLYQI